MQRLGPRLMIIPASARPAASGPPVNAVVPFIAGTLTQGQITTTDPGEWSGLPSGAYSFQHQRWDGDSFENIGAPNSTGDFLATADDYAAGTNGVRRAVTAENSEGSTTAYTDPVTIAAELSISGNPPDGTVGGAYTFTPTVSGGHAPRTFALTGTLPAGLSFNTGTGAITGNPLSAGTASGLNITVTDVDGLTDALGTFDIAISAGSVPDASLDFSEATNSQYVPLIAA